MSYVDDTVAVNTLVRQTGSAELGLKSVTVMLLCSLFTVDDSGSIFEFVNSANDTLSKISPRNYSNNPFVGYNFAAHPIVIEYTAASPGPAPTIPTSSATATSHGTNELSTGAKAGIVVRAAIDGVALFLVVFLVVMRLRKKKAEAKLLEGFAKAKLDRKELGKHEAAKEVDGEYLHEMLDNSMPVEAGVNEAPQSPQELGGSRNEVLEV